MAGEQGSTDDVEGREAARCLGGDGQLSWPLVEMQDAGNGGAGGYWGLPQSFQLSPHFPVNLNLL